MRLEVKTKDPAGSGQNLRKDGTKVPVKREKFTQDSVIQQPTTPVQTPRIIVHPSQGGKYWWDRD